MADVLYSNRMKSVVQTFTATFKKSGAFYAAWVEEMPGVNTQGRTIAEARENLKEALGLVLEANQALLKKELGRSKVTREPLLFKIA